MDTGNENEGCEVENFNRGHVRRGAESYILGGTIRDTTIDAGRDGKLLRHRRK